MKDKSLSATERVHAACVALIAQGFYPSALSLNSWDPDITVGSRTTSLRNKLIKEGKVVIPPEIQVLKRARFKSPPRPISIQCRAPRPTKQPSPERPRRYYSLTEEAVRTYRRTSIGRKLWPRKHRLDALTVKDDSPYNAGS